LNPKGEELQMRIAFRIEKPLGPKLKSDGPSFVLGKLLLRT